MSTKCNSQIVKHTRIILKLHGDILRTCRLSANLNLKLKNIALRDTSSHSYGEDVTCLMGSHCYLSPNKSEHTPPSVLQAP